MFSQLYHPLKSHKLFQARENPTACKIYNVQTLQSKTCLLTEPDESDQVELRVLILAFGGDIVRAVFLFQTHSSMSPLHAGKLILNIAGLSVKLWVSIGIAV